MSHDMMTQQISPELDEEPAAIQTWSIESYADSLMDELFEEVDRILDGGANYQVEPPPQETTAIQPIASANVALPPMLVSNRFGLARSEELDSELLATDVIIADPVSLPKPVSLFDRILLSVACLSMVFTGLIWLANQGRLQGLPFLATTPVTNSPGPSAGKTADVQPDTQFLEYFQRSLEALDRQKGSTTVAQSSPSSAATVATNALPTVTVPGTPGQTAATKAPTVLERVYIPVYQPPQFFSNLPAASTATVPSFPAGSFPVQSAPMASVPAPAPSHTLVGVLDLGNRSAALFEINGTAQRVNVGEGIGTSGWTLVKVDKQEAIVRRNGEVRSIYVGQKF